MLLGDGIYTNLCLHAETDMIATDEDMNMEDQIPMLYYSVSTCFCPFSVIPCTRMFIHLQLYSFYITSNA